MVGVLIVTHLQLAEALLSASDLILGRLEKVAAVSLDPNAMPDEARQQIADGLARLNSSDGVLLLTDMFGGTPSNLCLSFLKENQVEVISGVNLPMLIKVNHLRNDKSASLREMALALKQSGQEGITVASELLHKK
ncbi:PTS sugar transporter subunit IIA [Desulfobacca acetoxidans]|uniref:PTS system fructose subfamily IIA component n=1 Tax=Desulfobacca acetoxidans (strain ATCC 700848 / DSM 11109 / ASRB2) TaxID=880072 RepID=F2NJY7_DESAR|nr:PTS sugar transporter subunit IIA [Desulfobacca acetoxidans]AEB09931.1 PTS system fructose subfamily IIA component [Desulfobacca acetoxidans DSM 11109]